MRLFSFDPKKNKQVLAGDYDTDMSLFIKKVKKNHFMVLEKGYGLSEDIIQQLSHLQCQKIRIITTKKIIYDFEFNNLLSNPIKDYGHGKQRFLRVI